MVTYGEWLHTQDELLIKSGIAVKAFHAFKAWCAHWHGYGKLCHEPIAGLTIDRCQFNIVYEWDFCYPNSQLVISEPSRYGIRIIYPAMDGRAELKMPCADPEDASKNPFLKLTKDEYKIIKEWIWCDHLEHHCLPDERGKRHIGIQPKGEVKKEVKNEKWTNRRCMRLHREISCR